MQPWLLDSWMRSEWMDALSWTFMHSLWLGLLAAILAAIVIAVTKTARPRIRYNLLGLVLLLFVVAIIFTYCKEYLSSEPELVNTLTTEVINEDIPVNITRDYESTVTSEGVLSTMGNWYASNSSLFMLAWIFFFLINCVKMAVGLASVHRLRNYQTYPVTEEWSKRLEQLRSQLQIRKPVVLLQSALVKMPVALGILKPVILLPIGLITHLPPEQVESVLMHELGHIRRKDYLVNIIQHFTEAIFFFNPGILWISSLLRQEREACCDDIVLQNIRHKSDYLQALVAFQEYSYSKSSYVMGIGGRKQFLLNRVKRMLTSENKRLNVAEKLALIAGIIIFSAFTMVKQNKEIDQAIATAVKNLSIGEQYPVNTRQHNEPTLVNEKLSTPDTKGKQQGREGNSQAATIERTSEIHIEQAADEKKHLKDDYNPGFKSQLHTRVRKEFRFTSNEVMVKKEQLNYRTTLTTGLKFKLNAKLAVPMLRFAPGDTSLQKAQAGYKVTLQTIEQIKEDIGELKQDIAELQDHKKTLTAINKKEEENLDKEINAIRVEIERRRKELEVKRGELAQYNALIRALKISQPIEKIKYDPKGIGAPPGTVYQPIKPELKPQAGLYKPKDAIYKVEKKGNAPEKVQPGFKIEAKSKPLFTTNTEKPSQELKEAHRAK